MQLDNQFGITRIKLSTFDYPEVVVKTWSNVFEKGGSVNVEAKTPEGNTITLNKQDIDDDRSVVDEREYARELADEWNKNCKENWLTEILRCYEYITDYQQEKIDDFDKEVALLKEYKTIIKKARRELTQQLSPTKAKSGVHKDAEERLER
ncbi:MAG TPA: hypothetical protein VII94_00260 [Candidatus Saccharimonadales bacterium]